jgi:hypothetical protein
MKTVFITLFILNLLANSVSAQLPTMVKWDKRFGGNDGERLTGFIQTDDNGFFIYGYSPSGSSGNKTDSSKGSLDYWVVKIDSIGNKHWDKSYGGSADDLLFSAKQTLDGGFILGGFSYSDSSGDKSQNTFGNEDYWIVKIDSLGNKQWDKTFGGNSIDQMYSVQPVSDGGYVLGGFSYSDSSGSKTQASYGSKDYWIIKTDSVGNQLWDKSYGGAIDDWFTKLQQTNDDGFIIGGFSNSDSSGTKKQNSVGGYDYWIVKTDANGTQQWDKTYGGLSIDGLYALQQTADSGYILGGVSISNIGGDKTQPSWGAYDYWIIKTDAAGNLQWDKDLGGDKNEEVFGTIEQTPDGGFLLAGNSYSNISGNKTEDNFGAEQSWLIKTDAGGSVLWDKTIFTNTHEESGYALLANDGSYVIANSSDAPIGGYKSEPAWNSTYDYWLVKMVDSVTISSIDLNSTGDVKFQLQVYPNPVTNLLFIKVMNVENSVAATFTITNTMGQLVFEKAMQLNSSAQQLDLTFLHSGVYFLSINKDGINSVVKLIKQ